MFPQTRITPTKSFLRYTKTQWFATSFVPRNGDVAERLYVVPAPYTIAERRDRITRYTRRECSDDDFPDSAVRPDFTRGRRTWSEKRFSHVLLSIGFVARV